MWTFTRPEKGFLTPEEHRQVEVLFSEIIPSDALRGSPGAREAQAANFLSSLLACGPEVFQDIPAWRELYRTRLAQLDGICRETLKQPLESLDGRLCIQLLERLASGRLEGPMAPKEQTSFFELLRTHCIQGCFSDPRWGGNADKVMWRWYGYLQPAEDSPAVYLGGNE
jgi:gluconate 2-dehydrogenase gamma chain